MCPPGVQSVIALEGGTAEIPCYDWDHGPLRVDAAWGVDRNFGCADFGAAGEARNHAGWAIMLRKIKGVRGASESRVVRF